MVSPEPPDDAGQIFRKHTLLLSSTGQCKQLPGIILAQKWRAVSRAKERTSTRLVEGRNSPPEWGPGLGYSQVPQEETCPEGFWETGGGGKSGGVHIPHAGGRQSQSAGCPWP